MKVVYPGTFDPFTRGHEDLVRRASRLFDEVVVGVAASAAKQPFFTTEERVAMACEVLAPFRNVRIEPVPPSRRVVQVKFFDAPAKDRQWWLVAMPDGCVDLCKVDPGFDVDLYVNAELKVMTAIWMGLVPFAEALRDERVLLTGDRGIAAAFPSWLALSPFAAEQRMVA